MRGVHEGLVQDKCFITLTYNDEHIQVTARKRETTKDAGGTLVPEHLTNFWKRLRKELKGRKIKYIACGEYGETDWRPHYHAIIYGLTPTEAQALDFTQIWGHGFTYIDNKPFINSKAIAYTVGYVNKKMHDGNMWSHYEGNGRVPPFQRQSQGIGLEWSRKNPDWYHNLQTGYQGKECAIPRYYIKKVFQEEGAKVRLNNTIIRARDANNLIKENGIQKIKGLKIIWEEHTSIYYKTIINPDGKKTAVILSQMHEKALQSLIAQKNYYKLSEEQYRALLEQFEKSEEEKQARYRQEWQDYNTLTTEEFAEKYERTTVKFVNRYFNSDYQSIILPAGVDKATFIKQCKNAIETNKNIQERINKTKRDKIEKSKELEQFIQWFTKGV